MFQHVPYFVCAMVKLHGVAAVFFVVIQSSSEMSEKMRQMNPDWWPSSIFFSDPWNDQWDTYLWQILIPCLGTIHAMSIASEDLTDGRQGLGGRNGKGMKMIKIAMFFFEGKCWQLSCFGHIQCVPWSSIHLHSPSLIDPFALELPFLVPFCSFSNQHPCPDPLTHSVPGLGSSQPWHRGLIHQGRNLQASLPLLKVSMAPTKTSGFLSFPKSTRH